MKQKQPDKVEKRRPLVDLNLVGDTRIRSVSASRGCASLVGRLLAGLLLLVCLGPGVVGSGLR